MAVASRLGFRFVDTGAMYRAMTWLALERGVDVDDADALAALARGTHMRVVSGPAGTGVFVDGTDATPHLRDPDVEASVSQVSRVPAVRAALVEIQRELAREGRLIMAGRDIGSVVLPNADLKVYLDASPGVRAERRARQLAESGETEEVAQLTAEIERRDQIDSTREASPLTVPPDAVIINTDELTLDQVVAQILELAA